MLQGTFYNIEEARIDGKVYSAEYFIPFDQF